MTFPQAHEVWDAVTIISISRRAVISPAIEREQEGRGPRGPRRTFWRTDPTRMPCTYRECISLFTEELPRLEGADLEWVIP